MHTLSNRALSALAYDRGEEYDDLWGMVEDEQVQRRATDLVRELESELLDAGLEPRAGFYED
ncbi:MAG: hypothetical protein ACLPZR_08320 [Solirubrobacteraceae bacterium]